MQLSLGNRKAGMHPAVLSWNPRQKHNCSWMPISLASYHHSAYLHESYLQWQSCSSEHTYHPVLADKAWKRSWHHKPLGKGKWNLIDIAIDNHTWCCCETVRLQCCLWCKTGHPWYMLLMEVEYDVVTWETSHFYLTHSTDMLNQNMYHIYPLVHRSLEQFDSE